MIIKPDSLNSKSKNQRKLIRKPQAETDSYFGNNKIDNSVQENSSKKMINMSEKRKAKLLEKDE